MGHRGTVVVSSRKEVDRIEVACCEEASGGTVAVLEEGDHRDLDRNGKAYLASLVDLVVIEQG